MRHDLAPASWAWRRWREWRAAAQATAPDRRYGQRGVGALLVAVVLTVAVWATLDLTADDLDGDPAAVLVAGSQATTAQRLALELSAIALSADDPGGLDGLARDLDQLEDAHDGLIAGDADLGISGRPPASVQEVLYGSTQLDRLVRTFVADLRAVLVPGAPTPEPVTATSMAQQAAQLSDGYLLVAERYAADAEPPVGRIRALATIVVVAFLSLAGYLALAVVEPMRRVIRDEGDQLSAARALREVESRRHGLTSRLLEAFEMAECESDTLTVIGQALSEVLPDRPAELLLSGGQGQDIVARPSSSDGSPGCGVPSLAGCPAVRRSQRTDFSSSEALNACPHLRGREGGACSATCVPVSFMGRSLGVLHTTGPVDEAIDEERAENLRMLATHAGLRIGTLRSMASVEEMATTDSLTGLLNRRALDQKVSALAASSIPYAVAVADLDHFKRLNDEMGHERGDHALRLFSALVSSSLREGDLTCRWGGEEFVIVFVNVDRHEAARAAERLRMSLAAAVRSSGAPMFTVSMGIADSTMGTGFDEVVRLADRALLAAKGRGRDQVVIGAVGDPDALARMVMADALGGGEVVDLEANELRTARLAQLRATEEARGRTIDATAVGVLAGPPDHLQAAP